MSSAVSPTDSMWLLFRQKTLEGPSARQIGRCWKTYSHWKQPNWFRFLFFSKYVLGLQYHLTFPTICVFVLRLQFIVTIIQQISHERRRSYDSLLANFSSLCRVSVSLSWSHTICSSSSHPWPQKVTERHIGVAEKKRHPDSTKDLFCREQWKEEQEEPGLLHPLMPVWFWWR